MIVPTVCVRVHVGKILNRRPSSDRSCAQILLCSLKLDSLSINSHLIVLSCYSKIMSTYAYMGYDHNEKMYDSY